MSGLRSFVIWIGAGYLGAAICSLYFGASFLRFIAAGLGCLLFFIMVYKTQLKMRATMLAVIIVVFALFALGIVNVIWSDGRSVFAVIVLVGVVGLAWSSLHFRLTSFFYEWPFFALIIMTISLVLSGYGPKEFNSVLNGYSRNGYSAILLIFSIGYIFSRLYRGESPSSLLLAVAFLCSLPLYGRAGIVMAALVFLVVLAHCFRYTALPLILVGAAVLVFQVDRAASLVAEQTNFSSGLNSPRLEMWVDYLSRVDVFDLFFGVDLFSVPTIVEYGGNPHNSFIMLHAYFGFGLFLLLAVFAISAFRLMVNKRILLFSLLCIYLARSFFDIIYLFGLFDYLVAPIFLYFAFEKQCELQFKKGGRNNVQKNCKAESEALHSNS